MRTRIPYSLLLVLFVLLSSTFVLSQIQLPASDPQALALATRAISALTRGVSVNDVTLTGSAIWIAGSDKETGSAVLMAKGRGESRIDLTLTSGARTDVRSDIASVFPEGASSFDGGGQQPWSLHNCWTSASWFFPAFPLLGATFDPSIIVSYVGQETRGGTSVQHLHWYRYLSGQQPSVVALTQRVSTTDFYLDSASLLPVALTFNTHPDDDANTDILIEIKFSNYQPINGVQIPFHIQKLISGGLALDVAVARAALNSSLPDGLFAIAH